MKKLLSGALLLLAVGLFAKVPYSYYDFENSNLFEKFSPNGYSLIRDAHCGAIGIFKDPKTLRVTDEDAYSGKYSLRLCRRPKEIGQLPLSISAAKSIPVPAVVEFMVKRSEKTAFTAAIFAQGKTAHGEGVVVYVRENGKMGLYDAKNKGYTTVTHVMPHNHWGKIRFNVGKEETEVYYVASGKEVLIGTVPSFALGTKGVNSLSVVPAPCKVDTPIYFDDVAFMPQGMSFDFNRVNLASSLNGAAVEAFNGNKTKIDGAKLIDGKIADFDSVVFTGTPAVAEIKLAQPSMINLIRIYPGQPKVAANASGDIGIKAYKVEIHNNGYWHTVADVKNMPDFLKSGKFSANEYYYLHAFPSAKAEAVRVTITESGDKGKRASGKSVPLAQRASCIREIEVFSSDSKVQGAVAITSILKGDFPLAVYRDETSAELSFEANDIKEFEAVYTLFEEKSKKVRKEGKVTIKNGVNKFKFDLLELGNGRFIFHLKAATKESNVRGILPRMLRVDRHGKMALPAEPVKVSGMKIFPIDDYHFAKREGVAVNSTEAKLYQVSKTLSPERGLQQSRGSFCLDFQDDGTFVVSFFDALRSGRDKKYHFAYSKDLKDWTIVDELPANFRKIRPVKNPFPPRPAAEKWRIKTPLKDATIRFWKESDGVPPLNEVRVQWFYPPMGDVTKFGIKTWAVYPIWEKGTEWLVLTKDPILVDKFSFDSDELEDDVAANDNFMGQWISDDGKTIFYGKAGKLRRFPPYTVEYDNLAESARFMRVYYSNDGFNWKYKYLTVGNLKDHWTYQHYGAHPHRVDKDFYLAYLHAYHCGKQQIYPELIYSRNGLEWYRLPNPSAFIKNTPIGTWAFGMIFMESLPHRFKDKHYFIMGTTTRRQHFYNTYREDISNITADNLKRQFGGRNLAEQWPFFKEIGGWEGLAKDMHAANGCVGLAEMRYDGWIATTAEKDNAVMQSRVFSAPGTKLILNAKGSMAVSLVDKNGKTFDGFTASFSGDEVEKEIVWDNGKSALPSGDFAVKMVMKKGTELYTLKFAE